MAESTGEIKQAEPLVSTEQTVDRAQRTPYSVVTLEAFGKSFPEHAADLDFVLEAIDRQLLENYSQEESTIFPGVAFPMSRVSIVPSMVRGFNSGNEAQQQAPKTEESKESNELDEQSNSKKISDFIFPAFAVPPDGGPFYPQDVGIDRVIRELPKVARALQNGEVPPEITVYFMGSPTALGGQVTEEWIAEVNKNGMDTYGRLYAEYVNSMMDTYTAERPSDENAQKRFTSKEPHGNDSIKLIGVSKGAVVADRVSDHLNPKLQRITQRLFDNPAGDHKPGEIGKAVQSALGLVGETAVRLVADPNMMQPLTKRGASFNEYIQKTKNITPDSKEQQQLKMKALLAESKKLFSGQPLDKEKRSFIRQGLQDPLTASMKDFRTTKEKVPNASDLLSSEGHILKSRFEGHHFFYLDRYERWVKILDYCKKPRAPQAT